MSPEAEGLAIVDAVLVAIRLFLRRAWRSFRRFLDRNGLDALPAAGSAVVVILLGLAIPLWMSVDTRPTSLSTAVAERRLEELVGSPPQPLPPISPVGDIVSRQPVFRWRPVAEAAGYRFRLYRGNLLLVGTDFVETPRFVAPADLLLDPGETYLFKVMGRDADGTGLGGWRQAVFTVRAPDETLADLLAQARSRLGPDERALVLAGYYAWKGMPHDLAAELEGYVADAPEGRQKALAERVLARLGHR